MIRKSGKIGKLSTKSEKSELSHSHYSDTASAPVTRPQASQVSQA